MKKLIFGCTLMICGIISVCTEYLAQQILFAAPDVAIVGENSLLSWGGGIAIAAGFILCIATFLTHSGK